MEETVGRLVLASASPRRKEILEHAGFGLAVVPSGVEEHIRGESPAEVVENLASDKAGQVAARLGQEGACVVGADTVVVLDGRILGKPKDEQEACQMLATLAGRSHQVLTGVCIVWEGVPRVFSEKTEVWVSPMSQEEIQAYVSTGEPMDKAGAYGIQGAFAKYVERIDGDYLNVVGFPLNHFCRVYKNLKEGRAAIFDLDGTLADTLESIAHCTNRALGELGYGPLETDAYRYYAGDGAKELLKRALAASGDTEGERLPEMEAIYGRIFQEDCMYHVQPFDGIPETVRGLKNMGYRVAVLSNKPHARTVDVISALFGEGVFDAVQGQVDGIPRKPCPDGALALAEQFGVRPENCLYMGDTDTDMQTACAAGMYAVGVLWGFRDRGELMDNGAQVLVDRPQEILGIAARR